MAMPWLSMLTFSPAICGLLLLSVPARVPRLARTLALATSLLMLAAMLLLWHGFDASQSHLQFEEAHRWAPALGLEYHVGIDGIGLLMLLLSALVVPIAILAAQGITERPRNYFSLVLMLESCLFGTFTAMNFLHWFLWWELGLVPAYFLIRWSGTAKAGAAAMQFLVYTMVGSVTLLLAFVALFGHAHTFDFVQLARMAHAGPLLPRTHISLLIFAGALLGFAVKVPLVPFHTWLPDAYTEAPASTTILLTGAMSKMGLYGFVRILLPIFAPQMREWMTPLLWLAVASVVLPAFAAIVQQDLKRMFAYSSVNHLGYGVLGILAVAKFAGAGAMFEADRAAALDGALLQMLNHAVTAGLLFWFVALLQKRSGGPTGIADFGGLRKPMPVFAGLMGIAVFSSLGLPGLNGFIGEFLLFRGVLPLAPWAAGLSILGLLATAIFLLSMVQRVFWGPVNPAWQAMPDLTRSEILSLAPAIALMFLLGLWPQLVLGFLNTTVLQLVSRAVQ